MYIHDDKDINSALDDILGLVTSANPNGFTAAVKGAFETLVSNNDFSQASEIIGESEDLLWLLTRLEKDLAKFSKEYNAGLKG